MSHLLRACQCGRRRFLVAIAALLATPLAANAQSTVKPPRVGVLHAGSSNEATSIQREPFERGLGELGWTPGANVLVDYRYAEGNAARLPQLARELVGSDVQVIVARGDAAVRAARDATASIPIVMSAWAGDPVADGIVKSFAQPGGNVTGLAGGTFELDGKRLELLKETFPKITSVAILANPRFEAGRYQEQIAAVQRNARSVKLQAQVFEVTRAEELAKAFDEMRRGRFGALLVRGDPLVLDHHRREIGELAAKYRLPAVYHWPFFVEAGGLMSYGISISALHHRSASYVSRILKGAKPGELPLEQLSELELVINLKAARGLGIEIPKAVLFRATKLIE
jgi:putative ABC transport system substrate-binding protein